MFKVNIKNTRTTPLQAGLLNFGALVGFLGINPFQPNVPFIYPQKTFSDFFRGYRNGTLGLNGLILFRVQAAGKTKQNYKLYRTNKSFTEFCDSEKKPKAKAI